MKNTIKIAIIDDHLLFLKGLTMLLEQDDDFEVIHSVTDYSDLLKNLKLQKPDILITDISMPEINGIELSKMVHQIYPTIKILVMSSYSSMMSASDVDGYLLKDTNSEILIESIKKIVWNNEKIFHKDFQTAEKYDFNKSIVSKREKEIINFICKGYTTEEISEKLYISKHTVETHRKNIFSKLQVHNIAGLVKTAVALGIIDI